LSILMLPIFVIVPLHFRWSDNGDGGSLPLQYLRKYVGCCVACCLCRYVAEREMIPKNSLHALVVYSKYNKSFGLISFKSCRFPDRP